ncbi:MAG: RluA family pseudouridine synthase [Caldimicrobium thiodismutans]|uniref:RluA family pseudouridine synthase n=1 Tax=Caldimicrobium thiodismutans TaxID=1653476 RepID=A0A2N7PKR5_9BACT|nr:MAG: RluA family pseudouridine synthase [Caldimicrobium thiodismutans]
MEILYEDKYLVLVNKPAGLIVQGTREKEKSLLHKLKSYLKNRDKKEGAVFLAVVHRLDKPVSGALVLAKRSKTASKMFKIIQERQFDKIYLAKVEGKMREPYGIWEDITEDEKWAITFFYLLRASSEFSWCLFYPLTGRKHQLRKALSKRGHPIIGDLRYGSKIKIEGGKAILLHSLFLSFPHPHREERLEIIAPIPYYFNRFLLDKKEILEFLNRVKTEKERFSYVSGQNLGQG